jgi:hypothetical protein
MGSEMKCGLTHTERERERDPSHVAHLTVSLHTYKGTYIASPGHRQCSGVEQGQRSAHHHVLRG